jgi:hypothetical protein
MGNYFEELNSLNVNEYTEEREGLTYLTWSYAIQEVLKKYPSMDYKIKKFGEQQLPYVYDKETGYMVFTEVTLEGITREMWLPVMDSKNKAMKSEPYTYETKKGEKTVESATMFDINKTIMRCLVKNLAMFGLGLYIYSGEDLPEVEAKAKATEEQIEKIKELVPEESMSKMLTYYKIDKLEDLLETDAKDLIARKEKAKAKAKQNETA